MNKASRRSFLAGNPFPRPLTLGFFYREKMRAIHRVAPDDSVVDVLEVGGGQSGLGSMLYPNARIVNIDLNADYARSAANQRQNVQFLPADATRLPFADESFDLVTMFDLLEHVPSDHVAVAEAKRVLRPGGCLLVSTPRETWRFPYYRIMRPICPHEEQLFEEWGHVRRGYSPDSLEALVPMKLEAMSSFINPLTVINHDFAFSKLPKLVRWGASVALSPLTWVAYAVHRPNQAGTETASRWRKEA